MLLYIRVEAAFLVSDGTRSSRVVADHLQKTLNIECLRYNVWVIIRYCIHEGGYITQRYYRSH